MVEGAVGKADLLGWSLFRGPFFFFLVLSLHLLISLHLLLFLLRKDSIALLVGGRLSLHPVKLTPGGQKQPDGRGLAASAEATRVW